MFIIIYIPVLYLLRMLSRDSRISGGGGGEKSIYSCQNSELEDSFQQLLRLPAAPTSTPGCSLWALNFGSLYIHEMQLYADRSKTWKKKTSNQLHISNPNTGIVSLMPGWKWSSTFFSVFYPFWQGQQFVSHQTSEQLQFQTNLCNLLNRQSD